MNSIETHLLLMVVVLVVLASFAQSFWPMSLVCLPFILDDRRNVQPLTLPPPSSSSPSPTLGSRDTNRRAERPAQGGGGGRQEEEEANVYRSSFLANSSPWFGLFLFTSLAQTPTALERFAGRRQIGGCVCVCVCVSASKASRQGQRQI